MSETIVEVIAAVIVLLVLALAFDACPAENCEEAVSRCAVSEGVACGDVAKRCEEKTR